MQKTEALDGQCHSEIFLIPDLVTPHRSEHYLRNELCCGSTQERAHSVPLIKGKKPSLLSSAIQNRDKSRRDEMPLPPCIHRNCGTFSDFPNPTPRCCEQAKGAVPRYTSITWCAQGTARQWISWRRSLNWLEWSYKKKKILAVGKGRIGRQTTYSNASMTRWFLAGIKKSNML